MNSNRLDVFAASLQWADEVKVVSRGTSRSPMSSATEKDEERGEVFPTVRHERLFELIGRSHSPAQAQAKEREERRRRKSAELYWLRRRAPFTEF